MPSIAIVDDRADKRETMSRVVRSTLKRMKQSAWSVVADEPPSNEKDILHWLDENDATVLVSDWKLNEGAKGKRVVNYEADRLIREIRASRPTFPIFVVTGFEAEAQHHLKDVENIFGRDEFTRDVENILPQVLRAGQRRYEEQRDLLARMDSLSRSVAGGKASAKEHKDLRSLQGYFQADLSTFISLDGVLSDFEEVKKSAEAMRRKVERRMSQRKKK